MELNKRDKKAKEKKNKDTRDEEMKQEGTRRTVTQSGTPSECPTASQDAQTREGGTRGRSPNLRGRRHRSSTREHTQGSAGMAHSQQPSHRSTESQPKEGTKTERLKPPCCELFGRLKGRRVLLFVSVTASVGGIVFLTFDVAIEKRELSLAWLVFFPVVFQSQTFCHW